MKVKLPKAMRINCEIVEILGKDMKKGGPPIAYMDIIVNGKHLEIIRDFIEADFKEMPEFQEFRKKVSEAVFYSLFKRYRSIKRRQEA